MIPLPNEIRLITAMMVLIAMYYDARWRIIPNTITFPAMSAGLILHTAISGWGGFLFSGSGLLLGGGIFLIIYMFGAMGAGDVKLMGAAGALLGTEKVILVLFLTSFIGGLMAAYKVIAFYFTRKFASSGTHGNSGEKTNPLKEPIPYGIAIGGATLITLIIK